tara:strand:- start:289 stop:450 length:162 start_codon:yes stop_codon:yes gene_type:complete
MEEFNLGFYKKLNFFKKVQIILKRKNRFFNQGIIRRLEKLFSKLEQTPPHLSA